MIDPCQTHLVRLRERELTVSVLDRFERKVNLRKFDKYVTDVQIRAVELHGDENAMA
jgi:hypothetical protein